MKIGMLTASLSRRGGGMSEAVRQLSLAMDGARACEVRVFALRDVYTQDDLPAWGSLSAAACPVRGPEAFGCAPSLIGQLRQARLDLLHVHGLWAYPSLASLRWAQRDHRPYLVSPHGMLDPWALGNSTWKKRLAGCLFQRRHLKRAACLHALNMAELRAIRCFGLQNAVAVVPNGIDLPEEGTAVPPPWIAAVPRGSKVLLYLGRIHPKKGLPALIRAWTASAPEDWYLAIAGWDQAGHESELKRLVQELGIARSVAFVGPQFGKNKTASFHQADALVLPSLSEGLPVTVLEAWAYRLPVLMTAACNLPEGFVTGAAMEFPLDTRAMSGTLREFLDLSDSVLREMGDAGRRLVEEQFTWDRVALQMVEVYEDILRGTRISSAWR